LQECFSSNSWAWWYSCHPKLHRRLRSGRLWF
jgi:hypothetical protein